MRPDWDDQFAETEDERNSRLREKRVERWRSEAIAQLCELTKRWNTFEDIPKSQQHECRSIGERLHGLGGMNAMRQAYYAAKADNPAASVVAAYWDGVGEWQW